jgi:hypothetical protein
MTLSIQASKNQVHDSPPALDGTHWKNKSAAKEKKVFDIQE